MSHASPAFAFPAPAEPLVLSAARELAVRLSACLIVTRSALNAIMSEQFGGSDADGRWSVRDAHAALELAQVLFLNQATTLTCDMSSGPADRAFTRLEAQVPSQTTRSDEQIEWQQFATPPRIAWIAARACAISAGELLLEPSAGTGMLAVWAAKAGVSIDAETPSPSASTCHRQVDSHVSRRKASNQNSAATDHVSAIARCRAAR